MSYSKATDQKWQKRWAETNLYKYDENANGKSQLALWALV